MKRLMSLLVLTELIQSFSCEYILIQESKTWDEAQVYCRQNYFDLAAVQSKEDWIHVQRAVGPALTSLVWTGLYNDLNSWRWSYQDENITFKSWRFAEPNNLDGKQECGCLSFDGWTDRMCSEIYPFFCYNANETGANKIVLISYNLSWQEAQRYCRQSYTDLVTIHNNTENSQLLLMTQGYPRVWIGLFRDSWKWSGRTNVNTSSIAWRTGQPDMIGPTRPCGATGPNGLIEDQLCSNSRPFICEKYIKKKTVRVEVKSGENPHDQAVINAILQQIERTLKAHGIENASLTWRVQPDGNVFTPDHDDVENTKHC